MYVLDLDERWGRKGSFSQEVTHPGLSEQSLPETEMRLMERQVLRVRGGLSPLPEAAARLALFLQDVQVLLREDLHDLQEPLLACQTHAQTHAQREVLMLITSEVASLDELLFQRLEVLKERWRREIATLYDASVQAVAIPG